jgi:hypothetical protein
MNMTEHAKANRPRRYCRPQQGERCTRTHIAVNLIVQIRDCHSAMTSPSAAIFHPSCAYVQPNIVPSSETGGSSERCMPGFLCAALIEDISSSVSFTSYCVVSRPEPQRSGTGTGYQEIGTHAFGILCFGDDGRPALHGPRKRDLCWRRARACRCLDQRLVLEN